MIVICNCFSCFLVSQYLTIIAQILVSEYVSVHFICMLVFCVPLQWQLLGLGSSFTFTHHDYDDDYDCISCRFSTIVRQKATPNLHINSQQFSSFYSFILLSERFFAPTPIMNINHHPLNNTPFSPRSATTSSNQIQIQRTLQHTLILIVL